MKRSNSPMVLCMIVALITIILVVAISSDKSRNVSDNHDVADSAQTSDATNVIAENSCSNFPAIIYEDDICKITAEDFTEADEDGYTYYLPLTFENKSDEAFIVSSYYGTMNGQKVIVICIPESGIEENNYEFVVMPNETITETFGVYYATTSIRNISDVETIETSFTLYNIDFPETILDTGNVVIDVK